MDGFEVYYRNDGEYPPPEEIKITRGIHRFKGVIQDYELEEPVQYLHYDTAVEVDGELKRIHFNKLDVLCDGSFVAEVDVIDNWFLMAVIGISVVSIVGGTMAAIVFHEAGISAERSEDALEATALNLKWVTLIIISIGVFYIVVIRK